MNPPLGPSPIYRAFMGMSGGKRERGKLQGRRWEDDKLFSSGPPVSSPPEIVGLIFSTRGLHWALIKVTISFATYRAVALGMPRQRIGPHR